jgi:hypothetical protein
MFVLMRTATCSGPQHNEYKTACGTKFTQNSSLREDTITRELMAYYKNPKTSSESTDFEHLTRLSCFQSLSSDYFV